MRLPSEALPKLDEHGRPSAKTVIRLLAAATLTLRIPGVFMEDQKEDPSFEANTSRKTDLVHIFYALSDRIRLKIVRLLEDRELCVCDIMAALEMGQSRVSFHMGVLKSAGLISSRKVGRWNAYRLSRSKGAIKVVLDLVNGNRSVSISEENTRLRAFLKAKQRLAPDGRTPCCPEPSNRGQKPVRDSAKIGNIPAP